MSKVKFSNPENKPSVGWGYAYVLNEYVADYLIGNIMPVIEIMGLPDKQEEALKNQVKQIVRESFNDGVYITPERHTEIRLAWLKAKEENKNQAPMSAI